VIKIISATLLDLLNSVKRVGKDYNKYLFLFIH